MSRRLIVATLLALSTLAIVMASSAVHAGEAAEAIAANPDAPSVANNQVLCVCRCCFHSECSYIANASWMLDDCSSCNAERCQNMILSTSTRNRVAKTFRILEELQQAERASTSGSADAGEDTDRKVMVQHTLESLAENKWNVCEVTAMVEATTCRASRTPGACQSSADLSAICYDRQAATVKFGTLAFIFLVVGGCAFALLGKNSMIGCQAFNEAAFDY